MVLQTGMFLPLTEVYMNITEYVATVSTYIGVIFRPMFSTKYLKAACLTYMFIQGDSGGICNTLGNDSMCDSKQKSSYEHGSDFGRLQSYGHLLIPLHALV